jgi:hypothetical protein
LPWMPSKNRDFSFEQYEDNIVIRSFTSVAHALGHAQRHQMKKVRGKFLNFATYLLS